MRWPRFRFRLGTLICTVLVTGIGVGTFTLARRSGFFQVRAQHHAQMQELEGLVPSVGTVTFGDGDVVTVDHPETSAERAARLRRVAYHKRMRKIYSWLDGRPVDPRDLMPLYGK
jgi:hypothetical protein